MYSNLNTKDRRNKNKCPMVSLKNQLLHNQYFVFLLVYTCKKKAWKKILTEGQGGEGGTDEDFENAGWKSQML